MIERVDLASASEALELLELQRAAYRIEAELIGHAGLPPLREGLDALQGCGETVWGHRAEGRLGGALAYRREAELLDIHRLIVDPGLFRRGIAGALLRHVEQSEPGVRRIVVSTAARNAPALRLYRKHGYELLSTREVEPGLVLAFLEKRL